MKAPNEMTPQEILSLEWLNDLETRLERLQWKEAIDDLPYLTFPELWGLYTRAVKADS